MSAFVVPHAHITVLAVFIKQHGIGPSKSVQEIGEMLYAENVKSVCYRYADKPEEYGKFAIDERAAFIRPSLVQILKAANCLDYQSCEHPGYYDSDTRCLMELVMRAAIKDVPPLHGRTWTRKNIYEHPEYDRAAWVIDFQVEFPAVA